ncbi:putative membrane protein [Pseudomonas sp. TE3911]
MIISIQYLYWLAGVLLLITAGMILLDRTHPKRWSSALFWLLFAIPFLVGERLPSVVIGAGVVVMALIAGFGGVGRGTHVELHDKASRASAGRLGHKLFIPALAIPLTTVIGSVLLKHTEIGGIPLLDPKNTHLRVSRYRLSDRSRPGLLADPRYAGAGLARITPPHRSPGLGHGVAADAGDARAAVQ